MSDFIAILLYLSLPVVYALGYVGFGYFGWGWGLIGGVSLVVLEAFVLRKKLSPAYDRHSQ